MGFSSRNLFISDFYDKLEAAIKPEILPTITLTHIVVAKEKLVSMNLFCTKQFNFCFNCHSNFLGIYQDLCTIL